MSLNTWNHRRKAFILQMSFVCRVGYMNIEVCVCWGTCAMVKYICHAGVCEPCWSLCILGYVCVGVGVLCGVCVCWGALLYWSMYAMWGVCVLGCVCSVGMCICWVHVPCGLCPRVERGAPWQASFCEAAHPGLSSRLLG